MTALNLPLELQQQVFSYLDSKSFYAARNVCRWWRYASMDAVTLAKQLQRLPVQPQVNAAHSNPQALLKIFNQAAHTLMLGTRVEKNEVKVFDTSAHFGAPKVTRSKDGKRAVTLDQRTITVYDTSRPQPTVLNQRPINDLKETLGGGPWLKCVPASDRQLALSSNGSLLAVAQDRTIQIYDLTAEPDSFTIGDWVRSAAGHYIAGLDFEQNDRMLKVRLSGKGTVLYLGTPQEGEGKAGMYHWRSRRGLRHAFLDSSALHIKPDSPSGPERVAGLQLLGPFANGWLFASQKHGGGESSHYILGHAKVSTPDNHIPTVEANVSVLAALPSFLSSWSHTMDCQPDFGQWDSMPCAHEHHPTYALSADGRLLAMAENDKKKVHASPAHKVYVYRLPGWKQLCATLAEKEKGSSGALPNLVDVLDKETVEKALEVQRIPLCLDTTSGRLTDFGFEEVEQRGRRSYGVRAVMGDITNSWMLIEY